MNSRILTAVAVLALALGAVLYFRPSLADPTRTPQPTGEVAPSSVVESTGAPDASPEPDIERMMATLSALAHDSMAGRAVGTEGSARARTFLLARLGDIGLEPVGPSFEHSFSYGNGSAGVNLVGRVPGTADGTIVLTAHYDHLGISDGTVFNGTDDNASGVVAVLEIARAIMEVPLEHTVVFALLDAEEDGLEGARAFLREATVPRGDIQLNVNLDMVSRSAGTLWAAGAHHTPALRPVLETVAETAPTTMRLGHDRPNALEGDDWTQSSDHGPFHEAGIPFVYFGVEDHPDYHRPTDDIENVIPSEYLSSVQTILSAIRAIDAALPLPQTP